MPTTSENYPELDTFKSLDKLKKMCPAFTKGCPYANLEELDPLAEVSRCPAYKQGCPFSNRPKEEISALISQIPKDHPILTIPELPSCDDGSTLVGSLNQILQSEQEKKQVDILENPELASAMREGTKIVHRAAESSIFTKRFLKGEINADEYGRYINSLYFVYSYMEALLEEYKDHPVVKLIHFPKEINRKESLEKDLIFFYGSEKASALTDPNTMTPAVKKYVEAMREACDKNPALLIAHSYSRYLGDLSGGQILSKRLKKHVLKHDNTSWDSSDGLNFYIFENLGNQAEFKNFYRERLDSAKVNQLTRDLIVTEAVKSFELNIALFDEIQALSDAGKLQVSSYSLLNCQSNPNRFKSLYWTTSMVLAVGVAGFFIQQRFFKHK